MRTGRKLLHRLAVVTAAAALAGALGATAPASALPPDLLPMTVTNDSGRGEQVHLYVLGVNLATGQLGYVNAAGAFTAWSGGTLPPSPAPDVAIGGPAPGASTTLQIPRGLSGRVYMSFGEKLKFFLTPDGLVQPAPWATGDANHGILFDWSEFTYNNDGLWLNSSQVDMFSVPHSVGVTGADGGSRTAGELVAGGRNAIFDAVAGQSGDWGNLIHTRSDGTRLRVLSPHKGIDTSVFGPTYLDGYTAQAWQTYRDTTLTVVPFRHEPDTKFYGRTDGAGVLQFTDGSGARVASFEQPSTKDVFGCDGLLHAPNDHVVGPIARTLCAALHRSTLGYLHTQPTYDASGFYTQQITDHYSRIVHEHMVDGRAYGFAFDDVGGFESLVHDGSPTAARIHLTAF